MSVPLTVNRRPLTAYLILVANPYFESGLKPETVSAPFSSIKRG
jgi:hypothetical protein